MAISPRSKAIQHLYADWTDGVLALAELQEGGAVAGELAITQAQRWLQLVLQMEKLVDHCLTKQSPDEKRQIKDVMYDGAGEGWVIDLCEQQSPSISIRDVIKAEVASLLAELDTAPGTFPSPEPESPLIALWKQLVTHPEPGGAQALLLRDMLFRGLSPLLRTAARRACRSDKALADQVESEVYTEWMEGEVLEGFVPENYRLEGWLFGACRYGRMRVLRMNSRFYKVHVAMPVFDDGSQADPFDPHARSAIATPLRLAQLKDEAFPMVYADMKKDIHAGKTIVLPLKNGKVKTYRLSFQHLFLLQAAQHEQFDPDSGKAKHDEMSTLTQYGRAKNAEDWRVAQAYVRQHSRAEELASLLQPASTLRSLRQPGGANPD